MLTSTLLATLAIAGFGLPQSDTLKYRMFDLGIGSRGRSAGIAVNSNGWVLGGWWNGPCWYWRPGVGWAQFPTNPGFDYTEGKAINDKNMVACKLHHGGIDEAGIWDPINGVRMIPMPIGLDYVSTQDINSEGQIVGWAVLIGDQFSRGWVCDDGVEARNLGSIPDGKYSDAMYINDSGDIAGNHVGRDRIPAIHFWRSSSSYELIGHPQSGGANPYGLNNRGDLNLHPGTVGVQEDVRWTDGTWQDLGMAPGSNEGWASYCISDEGWVFGTGAIGEVGHAVFWRPGFGSQWLEDYVDDSKTGYTINNIVACSRKNGFLTGWASKPGERFTRAILLVPYPKKSAGG